MEFTSTEQGIVVLLEPGDEVLESLATVREAADVTGGFFTGIGAVDRATLGHYDTDTQEYTEETFEGQFEVTAFSGNVGPDKIHAHIQLAKRDFSTIGGHCSGARVSGTFEILLVPSGTTLEHELDERTGLDVFDLPE
ncbi:DNA-binding protein [Halodesulfurarchaeum sp. HSR-GB]|uniref:PPC domain-containing DNA-binding protein n=1 Tax=Halodesulfurarchaeum sp. HSR-GB TaxID=3074077 RepID=UPI00285C41D1|nr:DNA-binding protein [Halodesulfurarchaeum sp. HSR-GB]MDR5656966.1 DNA-binding protein [Halodesulfurarchaeum sp. HSR-GB]